MRRQLHVGIVQHQVIETALVEVIAVHAEDQTRMINLDINRS